MTFKILDDNEQILYAAKLGKLYIPKKHLVTNNIYEKPPLNGWYKRGADQVKYYKHVINNQIHSIDDFPADIETFFKNENYVFSASWYHYDVRHRLNGPAFIRMTGHEWYYIYGELYSKKNFWQHPLVINSKLNKILLETQTLDES